VPAPGKNGLFAELFFDKAVLLNIAASASLSFCPGLLEAAQAATPPSLDFFRNTSSDGVGRWGVYCLVLEKPGHIPLVYIGSGTKAKTGLRARWQQYEQLKYLNLWPRWVLKAHRDGYRIVHKGWLVSAPIPVAVNVPAFRLLFIAMEATFAFLLWTMKSSTKDYHMGSCCPWPRQKGLFGYGGLCNHNPLTESVVGNFDLTAQQLTALDVANRERRNALSVDYRVKAMATDPARRLGLEREYSETHRNKHREAYNARLRAFAAANPARHKARQARSRANIIASGKHRCHTCPKNCASPSELRTHNLSKKHLDHLAATTSSSPSNTV
jgi:hypothetical protein